MGGVHWRSEWRKTFHRPVNPGMNLCLETLESRVLKRVILSLIWSLRCCYKLRHFWYSVRSWLYGLSMHARMVVSSVSCPLIYGSIPNWDNPHMFPPSNFFSENCCSWIENHYIQGCSFFNLVTWTPLAIFWNSSEQCFKCINKLYWNKLSKY